MKRIVDGRRYDTATALEIAHNERQTGSFSDYHETLYRTKSGKWFLHGDGGPMTRWKSGDRERGWWAGEGIEPLTAEEAREWLEHAQCWEDLETYFDIEDA